MSYAIKPGYAENPRVCYFVDDVTSTRQIVFQPDVYTFAEVLAELYNRHEEWMPAVIDVGCGWADKLADIHDRHPNWIYTGIDFGVNLDHCRASYPWATWIDQDLEESGWRFEAGGAIVICSDVIEHVMDPRPLVEALRLSGAAAIVLSTPERDLQYGPDHMGPPPNPCHIREWNGRELASFLAGCGLQVRHVGLTRGNDRGHAMATQLLVCTP